MSRPQPRPRQPLRARSRRPRRLDRSRPPHGPGECLVLAAWLLLLTGGAVAAGWTLVSALL